VQLIISEPWEFETEVGTGTLAGRVSEVHGEEVVVDLDPPVTFSGVTIASVSARARYEGQRATDADANGVVCNFEPRGPFSPEGRPSYLIGTLRVC
jgi:hypothetical protein